MKPVDDAAPRRPSQCPYEPVGARFALRSQSFRPVSAALDAELIIQRKTARSSRRLSFTLRRSASIVPVTPIMAPASVTLDPPIGHPMSMPMGMHTMPLDPNVAVTRPVPVSRRPFPSRPDDRDHFVAWRRRGDTDVNVRCRGRRRDTGRERTRCDTEGKQRIALIHLSVLADCMATVSQQSRSLLIGSGRMST